MLTSVLILEFQYCWLLLSCGVPAVLTFATGVFDTGDACTFPIEYLREFTEKIEMSLMFYSGAWRMMIMKKLEAKNHVTLSL